MNNRMSKQKILELIRLEWQALEENLTGLDEAEMIRPGGDDGWSIKDIAAHLAAWEKKMMQWIQESLRGETPDRPAPGAAWADIDTVNRQLYEENKEKTLSEVLKDLRDTHRQSLEMVEGLTEDDLLNPDRFPWRQGYPLWHLVADNTWEHYKEHRETIEDRMLR